MPSPQTGVGVSAAKSLSTSEQAGEQHERDHVNRVEKVALGSSYEAVRAQTSVARMATHAGQGKPTVADEAHEKARNHVIAYNRRVEEIRKDDTLSDKGRNKALQAAYDEATMRVDGAKMSASASTHDRSQELRRTLFGLSPLASDAAVVAHRDAQDRVAGIKRPEDLGDLMDRAEASGDQSLLRAGFAEAYRRSKDPMTGDAWDGIVAEYAATHSDKQAALNELDALTNKFSRTAEMGRRMETTVLKPRELR